MLWRSTDNEEVHWGCLLSVGKPGKLPMKVGCKRPFHCGAFEVKRALSLDAQWNIPMTLYIQSHRSAEGTERSCSICPRNLFYAQSSPSQSMPTQPSIPRPKALGRPWLLSLASPHSIQRPRWVHLRITSRPGHFPSPMLGALGEPQLSSPGLPRYSPKGLPASAPVLYNLFSKDRLA